MPIHVISVPQFSAARRASAILKLLADGSIPAAIALTFNFKALYGRCESQNSILV